MRRAVLALALALAGCSGGTVHTEAALEIDCLGMMVNPSSSNWAYITAPLGWGCYWVGTQDITNDVTVQSTLALGASDAITPIFTYDGQEYRALSGTLRFDGTGRTERASGSYAVVALTEDRGSVDISGKFSWCDYLAEEDCPSTPTDPLEQRFEMSAPHLGTGGGGVSQCVMVYDAEDRAFSLDMQFGTYGGLNVGHLLSGECAAGGAALPVNRLRFQAGGVDGPGSYGPETTAPHPGGLLPRLESRRPLALDGQTSPVNRCGVFGSEAVVTTLGGESRCAFSFSEDEVTIDCDDIRDASEGGGDYHDLRGSFSLRADCTLTTRP